MTPQWPMSYINDMSKLNIISLFILVPFLQGGMVLVYDQDDDKLGGGKFEPLWHGPYIFTHIPKKGSYELANYEGNSLVEPQNGVYFKNYYT